MLDIVRRSLLGKFMLLFCMAGTVAGLNLFLLMYFNSVNQSNDYTLSALMQQMTRTEGMRYSTMEILEGKSEYKKYMQSYIQEYDSTLKAFTNGGILNGKQLTTPNEEIRSYIARNNQLWDAYKPKAMLISTSDYGGERSHSEYGEEGFHSENTNLEFHSGSNDKDLGDAFAYIQKETNDLLVINDQTRASYLKLASNQWQSANLMAAVFVGMNFMIFGLIFFYTKKFVHPIRLLKTTMDHIKSGSYESRVEVTTNDEVGSLARNFNTMIDVVQSRSKELELKRSVLQKTNEHLNVLSVQLKEQANKLREVDLAKEEFASMITHELKNPLVPIIGYCELLLDGTLGDLTKEQKEKVQIVYDSALALSQLVQDMLDIHKLEIGKMKFSMCDTSTKELIDHSVGRFKAITEARNIKLIDEVEEEIKLTCDAERVLQVISNLVSNAVKFVPEQKGRIEIHAKRHGNSAVLFSVSDNGIGIPKEKQQNLFKKFYQVDSSLRRNTTGSGLGLSICKGIVEAHNGRIWLESEEGKGSTFYFAIPAGGRK